MIKTFIFISTLIITLYSVDLSSTLLNTGAITTEKQVTKKSSVNEATTIDASQVDFQQNIESKSNKYRLGKYSGVLDVKQFGAKGDGHTDDSLAIQKAIDTAKVGQTVYLSPGKYAVSKTINLKAGVNLRGDDKYGTKVFPTRGNFSVFRRKGVALFTLSHFSINNQHDNVIGIELINSNRADLMHLEFLGLRYAWKAVDGGNHTFAFITSRPSTAQESGGFWMGSSQGGNAKGGKNYGAVISTITSCNFRVRSKEGRPEYIKLKRVANLLIANCEFLGSHSECDGFTIHDDSQGVHISNSAINGWGNAITVETGSYAKENNREPRALTFTNVEFDQNKYHAFNLKQVRTVSISGCTITSSFWGTSSNPVYIGKGSDKVHFYNNTIAGYFGKGAIGIQLDACKNTAIRGNILNGCHTAIDFVNRPQNTLVKDNIMKMHVKTKIGGDPSGGGNRISSNFDNPLKNVAPPVPVSGAEIINDSGYDALMILEERDANSLDNIVLNKATIRINKFLTIPIKANDTLKIHYTRTPTMKWVTQR